MRLSLRVTRIAALAAAAAALTVTMPAQANVGAGVGTDVDISRPTRNALPFVQVAQLNRNLDLRTRNVAVTCEAVGIGDAISTAITECGLYVNDGLFTNQPLGAPGALMASTTFSQNVPVGATVYGCTSVRVTFLDTSFVDRRTCSGRQIAAA